jgi:thioredoxin-related protein
MSLIKLITLLFGLQFVATPYAAEKNVALNDGFTNPGFMEKPKWFKSSFLDLKEDIADAKSTNRRLLLYFHQDGCPYCQKLLTDNFGQGFIKNKTRKNFDTIAINIWGDKEVIDFVGKTTTEKAFAKSLKVQWTPTIIIFDEEAKAVLRINGYFPPHKFVSALDYARQRQEKKMSFVDFLKKEKIKKASGKLHDDINTIKRPLNLAKTLKENNKPLVVLFEQVQCANCDELHLDILKRPQFKEILNSFSILVLNLWSNEKIITTIGNEQSIKNWAEELKIQHAPSAVFFANNGKEVFRTEAYLKAYHTLMSFKYVLSKSYKTQPQFQRYLQDETDKMRAAGLEVNLME